jgi:hypothetical protein
MFPGLRVLRRRTIMMASSESTKITTHSQAAAHGDQAERELSARRAYRIPDVCAATGLGRTSVYSAIKSGALIARRYGRCTIVLAEDLGTFLNNLPKAR